MKLDIPDDNQQQQQQHQQKQITNKMLLQTDVSKKYYLSCYKNFYFALKSKEVKRQYPKLLRLVFDYIIGNECSFDFSSLSLEDKAEIFSNNAQENPEYLQSRIISFIIYQKERIERKEIASGTLHNYIKVIKLFCEMNNILNINWKLIYRGLPTAVQAADDRIPTIEEVKRLLEFPDRRIKPIVLLMLSSGIRLGAFDFMKFKHITPIINQENGELIAGKLIVYPKEPEEYFTFITPESYLAIKEWMDFRASHGEHITGESWVMRDTWQKTNVRYGHRIGLAQYPKQFKSDGIKTLIKRAWRIQRIRADLKEGQKRHEFKTTHSFRKYFETKSMQVMKVMNVKLLMDHDTGISKSYYRPTEQELLEDFLKAINVLTINNNNNNALIEKEIKELKEKNENNEYIIQSKLQERDDAIVNLSDQVMKLMNEINELKNSKI
jgi:hypothetical protein